MPWELDGCDDVGGFGGDLGLGGDGVPGADVAGVDLVGVEILATQGTVFIADQAVFLDRARVEFDLDLDVARDGGQCRSQLVGEHLARFQRRVDVGVGAIAGVG